MKRPVLTRATRRNIHRRDCSLSKIDLLLSSGERSYVGTLEMASVSRWITHVILTIATSTHRTRLSRRQITCKHAATFV
jgi:hypothetical protein